MLDLELKHQEEVKMASFNPLKRRLIIYVLIFLFIAVHGVGAQQKFAKIPADIEVNPNDTLVLQCKILRASAECRWQRNDLPISTGSNKKYELAGNQAAGDCSLRINNASLTDDANWKCQMAETSQELGDALSSPPARVLVRAMPDPPKLVIYDPVKINPSTRTVTTKEGQPNDFRCESKRGNPPATIKWFIGDAEITNGTTQTNTNDSSKTWSAVSYLKYAFHKSQNKKQLRCDALHPLKNYSDHLNLDIQYAPKVTFKNVPTADVQEHVDSVEVLCVADANPSATVYWRKADSKQQPPNKNTIEFRPAQRSHSGKYFCKAQNEIGTSEEINFSLDVKYPPEIKRMQRELNIPVRLLGSATLNCDADGNPPPRYEWWQSMTDSAAAVDEMTFIPRGNTSELQLQNVTYMDQGKYICKVTNYIGGRTYSVRNDSTRLIVSGAPQVRQAGANLLVTAERGSDAQLRLQFCSNPVYSNVTWEWGFSSRLKPGHEKGKFRAAPVTNTTATNCYEAQLRISAVDFADSRHYYLRVDNEHGFDKHSVNLQVRDPTSMTMVLALIIVALVLLVVVIASIMYSFACNKWCFTERGDFRPNTDLSSVEKSGVKIGSDKNIANGKSKVPPSPSPESEIQYIHNPTKLPRPTTPQSVSHPHHLTKHQLRQLDNPMRNRQFETIITEEMLRYSDLQVPKISNNGSMRKCTNGNHYTKIQATPPPLLSFSRFEAPTPPEMLDRLDSFQAQDSMLRGYDELQEDEV